MEVDSADHDHRQSVVAGYYPAEGIIKVECLTCGDRVMDKVEGAKEYVFAVLRA